MNIYKVCVFSLCLCAVTGCDYLAVSDQLAEELTMEQVFDNASYTRRFHRGIYTAIPNVSFMSIDNSYATCDGLGLPWVGYSDEMACPHNNFKTAPSIGENQAS